MMYMPLPFILFRNACTARIARKKSWRRPQCGAPLPADGTHRQHFQVISLHLHPSHHFQHSIELELLVHPKLMIY